MKRELDSAPGKVEASPLPETRGNKRLHLLKARAARTRLSSATPETRSVEPTDSPRDDSLSPNLRSGDDFNSAAGSVGVNGVASAGSGLASAGFSTPGVGGTPAGNAGDLTDGAAGAAGGTPGSTMDGSVLSPGPVAGVDSPAAMNASNSQLPLGASLGVDYTPSGILDEDAAQKGLSGSSAYSDPPDGCQPPSSNPYRLYSFEDHDDIQATIGLDKKSHYVIGSHPDCDIVIKHESVAARHAVIQFRKPEMAIRVYILDLTSESGTNLNSKRIPALRYVELLDKDVIQLGSAATELLLIDDNAQNPQV